jgi:chromosome segregation ATPase
MTSHILSKYNNATLNTRSAATRINRPILCGLLALLFNSTISSAQTNVELIEREIEKAEKSLKTTEKFIQQLLWRDVPANQAETQELEARAAQIATELSALATTVDASQTRFLQSKNQLERSNRILITSQQELQQAKKEIENLERQTRLSLDTLANQAANIDQFEANTRAANATIEQSMPEIERLRSILETASQQTQLRDQQSLKLQQTDAEFEQTLSLKREQINAQSLELLALQKQLQTLKANMLEEQGDWNKVAAQVATRDNKRAQLEDQLSDNKRLIIQATQALETLEGELQKTKLATIKKRDELSTSKSNLVLARRGLKDSQQQLRRAGADQGDDQNAASREIALQTKIVKEIQANEQITSQLKKNTADILVEVGQLEKLLQNKNQSLTPLRKKTVQLRLQQQESIEQQSAERQNLDQASAKLIATDQRFQKLATELETRRQSGDDLSN